MVHPLDPRFPARHSRPGRPIRTAPCPGGHTSGAGPFRIEITGTFVAADHGGGRVETIHRRSAVTDSTARDDGTSGTPPRSPVSAEREAAPIDAVASRRGRGTASDRSTGECSSSRARTIPWAYRPVSAPSYRRACDLATVVASPIRGDGSRARSARGEACPLGRGPRTPSRKGPPVRSGPAHRTSGARLRSGVDHVHSSAR